MKKIRFALLSLSLLFPLTVVPRDTDPVPVLAQLEEFREAFVAVPCKNEARLAAVKELFLKMGAPETDIHIEKIKDVENIIIRKQGETDEKIVIGAHYDLTGEGSCGAADNWTGIVAIAHIYKSLKEVKLKKTLLFVGFAPHQSNFLFIPEGPVLLDRWLKSRVRR